MQRENKLPTVLILIDHMFAGGLERQIVELLKGNRKQRRFYVVFSSIIPGGQWEDEARRYSDIFVNVFRKYKYDIFFVFKLFRSISRLRFDVIHVFGWISSIIGCLVALKRNVPLVNGTIRKAPFKLSFKDRVARFFIKRADCIVSNSIAGLERFRISSRKNVFVIKNGIDFSRFESIEKEKVFDSEAIVICMVANFSPMKDHMNLLKAYSVVRNEYKNVKLLLIGRDRGNLKFVQNLAFELSIEDGIMYITDTNSPEKYIKGSDICILLSTQGEGTSNSILEYMALGKPVIATDCDGNREIIKDKINGILTNNDPQSVSDSIKLLLVNENLRNKIASNARIVVRKRFQLNRMLDEYSSLYQKVVGRRLNKR